MVSELSQYNNAGYNTFQYIIEITLLQDGPSCSPMIIWCTNNIGRIFVNWKYHNVKVFASLKPRIVRFCFKHEEDALVFLLVHGGKRIYIHDTIIQTIHE